MVRALRDGDFIEVQSWQLQVGDIVLVKEDEIFPCDMLLFASSANGDAYIQTSSLDGEKNLKKRQRAKNIERYILNSCSPDRILFIGECVSELPNSVLDLYSGKITICGETFA